jgi:hypothetical protein
LPHFYEVNNMTIVEVPTGGKKYAAVVSDFPTGYVTDSKYVGCEIYLTDTGLLYEVDTNYKLVLKSEGSASIGGIVVTSPSKSTVAQPTCTPTLTVGSGYVTGDYVGTSGVPMTFSGCANGAGYGGYVVSAEFINGTVGSVAAELWLFDTAPTPPADSAAWTITDAEATKLVTVIPFSTFYSSAANTVSLASPDGPARFVSATGNLFGCLVARGTLLTANGLLSIRLSVLPD